MMVKARAADRRAGRIEDERALGTPRLLYRPRVRREGGPRHGKFFHPLFASTSPLRFVPCGPFDERRDGGVLRDDRREFGEPRGFGVPGLHAGGDDAFEVPPGGAVGAVEEFAELLQFRRSFIGGAEGVEVEVNFDIGGDGGGGVEQPAAAFAAATPASMARRERPAVTGGRKVPQIVRRGRW